MCYAAHEGETAPASLHDVLARNNNNNNNNDNIKKKKKKKNASPCCWPRLDPSLADRAECLDHSALDLFDELWPGHSGHLSSLDYRSRLKMSWDGMTL